MHGDAVAVMIFLRRGARGFDRRLGKFSDAPQGFGDLTRLDFQLARIGDVLVGAAAATHEERTWRRDAVRRCGKDFHRTGLHPVSGNFAEACAHRFAGDGERDEDDASLVPRQTRAAVSDVGDLEVQFVSGLHRLVIMAVQPPHGDGLRAVARAGSES